MEKIGLFYGSDTGTTEEIANKIKNYFTNKEVELFNISNSSKEDFENFDKLILASSTWGDGDLQSDWDNFAANLNDIDFSKKTVALVGIGDQDGYPDTFCNSLAHLYNYTKEANIVGFTSTDGYEFDESEAVIEDEFVGLALDDDNQSELTDERIKNWINDIEKYF